MSRATVLAKKRDKPPVRQMLSAFPRAILAVARVAATGAEKHGDWYGWQEDPEYIVATANAMDRHALGELVDGPLDPEDGELHAVHAAWNALARAELILREREAIQREIDEGVETPAAVPEGVWTRSREAYDMVDHEHNNNGFSCPLVEPPTLQDRIDRAFDVVGTDPDFLTDDNSERCSFCGAAEEKEEHAFDCPNGVDLSQFKRLRALARAITTVEPAPAPVFEGGYVDEIVPRVPGQSERIRRLHDAEDALTGGDGWHNEETE